MLTDLDELLLTVNDSNSQVYIREAITAYRSGAIRSSVVSTWTAVIYDIIGKFRRLDHGGDPHAATIISQLNAAIASRLVRKMGEFEDSLLGHAESCEFISSTERSDLDRIKEDRNRCAHPAFGGDVLLYDPTPEIARTHIVHAIKHLLSQPPTQGKHALTAMMAELRSKHFPAQQSQARKYLRSRFLSHAKQALARNFLVTLAKELLLMETDSKFRGHEDAMVIAIRCVSDTHPAIYKTELKSLMKTIGPAIKDDCISYLFLLLRIHPSSWDLLDEAMHIKLQTMVDQHDDADSLDAVLSGAISVPQLHAKAMERIQNLDPSERFLLIANHPSKELVDVAVSMFARSPSYRQAEQRAELLFGSYSKHLQDNHLEIATAAVLNNNQIYESTRFPRIFSDFIMSNRPFSTRSVHLILKMMDEIVSPDAVYVTPSERRGWQPVIDAIKSKGMGTLKWPDEDEGQKPSANAEENP